MKNLLLESAIKKSNLKIDYIAEQKLNISESEFQCKRNGIIPFTDMEKYVLRDCLNMSDYEFRTIFSLDQEENAINSIDDLYNSNETMMLLSRQTIGSFDKSANAKKDIGNLLTAYRNENDIDLTMLVLDAFQLGYIYGKRAEREKK
ncbi:MAG: hypothetical protein K5879_00450 [Lachnospiraceae bacterium]|nr:hypothetical protein [Lachnospiraceae bacterium]